MSTQADPAIPGRKPSTVDDVEGVLKAINEMFADPHLASLGETIFRGLLLATLEAVVEHNPAAPEMAERILSWGADR